MGIYEERNDDGELFLKNIAFINWNWFRKK